MQTKFVYMGTSLSVFLEKKCVPKVCMRPVKEIKSQALRRPIVCGSVANVGRRGSGGGRFGRAVGAAVSAATVGLGSAATLTVDRCCEQERLE